MFGIFEGFKSHQTFKVGQLTSAIIGIVAFFYFILNFYSENLLIPSFLMPYFFAYLGWMVTLLLIKTIADLARATIKGKKCHHCGGSLEIFKYKCQNPECGREQ